MLKVVPPSHPNLVRTRYHKAAMERAEAYRVHIELTAVSEAMGGKCPRLRSRHARDYGATSAQASSADFASGHRMIWAAPCIGQGSMSGTVSPRNTIGGCGGQRTGDALSPLFEPRETLFKSGGHLRSAPRDNLPITDPSNG